MEIRTTEDDTRHQFVISDATYDRYGTVIPISAWDLTNYAKNPIVAYQHETGGWRSDPDTIIGKGSVWIEDESLLIGEVEYEPEDINPLAEKIRKKVAFGTLRSTSVGFLAHDGHWGKEERGEDENTYYFDHVELIEFSIVNVPANPNAVKRAFDEFTHRTITPPDTPEIITSPTDILRTRAAAWLWMQKHKNQPK